MNTLLSLKDMAAHLAARFDRQISDTTPYWWWKMHKKGELPVEMPTPTQILGRSPLWEHEAIEDWYVAYLQAIGEPVVARSRRRQPSRS